MMPDSSNHSASPNTADTIDELAVLARKQVERGELALAINIAERVINLDPWRPQGYLLKAQALAKRQDFQRASDVLRAGLEYQKTNAKLLNMARNIASELGLHQEALDFALRLSASDPANAKNCAFLVRSYLSLNNLGEAHHQAEAVIARHGNAQGWILKAQVLLAEGKLREAEEALRKGYSRDPVDPKLLNLARNVAFQNGNLIEALNFAEQLAKVAPGDFKNQGFLAQAYLAAGRFSDATIHADALIAQRSAEPQGWIILAQALAAQHRGEEALQTLRDAIALNGNDERLLALARSLAFLHGHFESALAYSLELARMAPEDERNQVFLAQSYMSSGKFAEAGEYLSRFRANLSRPSLTKTISHYRHFELLNQKSPALVEAWTAALTNRATNSSGEIQSTTNAVMIQYWSQGSLPDDVAFVFSGWQRLFERKRIGQIELYDRTSAKAWIEANAPEFLEQFSKAFHYAMESDIFRVAYASRRACIYMDIDCWPLENTAAILRFGVGTGKSMLYFRAARPWIANGFFITTPDCAFVRELAQQCLAIDLDALPMVHETIENSFGPARYNKVILNLLQNATGGIDAESVPDAYGCSVLRFGGHELYFTHDAAVASVKPPFLLGYKGTKDYWKRVSLTPEGSELASE